MPIRYLTIASVALAELLTVFFFRQTICDKLARHWHGWSYILEIFQRQLYMALLPVPAAFILWLHALERDGLFTLRFSPLMLAISLGAFAGTQELYNHPYFMQLAFAIAVLAGLFVFVPLADWLRRAVGHKRLIFVALIAAASAWGFYYVMQHGISYGLLTWTGQAASMVLSIFGVDNLLSESLTTPFVYDFYSSHFKIALAPFCCGFEGMFMICFLLSVLLLFDWERFKGQRLWLIYSLGIGIIFIVNVLRIVVFFSIGDWAFMSGAPGWAQSLKGMPFELFHSYAGWVMYLVTFGVFAAWLYRSTAKSLPLK